jgi:hypothetical protein
MSGWDAFNLATPKRLPGPYAEADCASGSSSRSTDARLGAVRRAVIPNATISAPAVSVAAVIQAAWNRCRLAAPEETPRIATRTLIPITAPICWNIETIALPVAVCSGARLTVADENNAGARPSPVGAFDRTQREGTDSDDQQCTPECVGKPSVLLVLGVRNPAGGAGKRQEADGEVYEKQPPPGGLDKYAAE